MKVSSIIQSVAGTKEGDEYTALVASVYEQVVKFGPEGTDFDTWEKIEDADGDLSKMPNAELTAAAAKQVLAAVAP